MTFVEVDHGDQCLRQGIFVAKAGGVGQLVVGPRVIQLILLLSLLEGYIECRCQSFVTQTSSSVQDGYKMHGANKMSLERTT